jgi:hypothetical protein
MLSFLSSRSSKGAGREGAFGNFKRSFNGCSESIKSLLSFDHFRVPQRFVARITRHILGGRGGLIRHGASSLETRIAPWCVTVKSRCL